MKIDEEIMKLFDNFMVEEYGKWRIGRVEAKRFIRHHLTAQQEEIARLKAEIAELKGER